MFDELAGFGTIKKVKNHWLRLSTKITHKIVLEDLIMRKVLFLDRCHICY